MPTTYIGLGANLQLCRLHQESTSSRNRRQRLHSLGHPRRPLLALLHRTRRLCQPAPLLQRCRCSENRARPARAAGKPPHHQSWQFSRDRFSQLPQWPPHPRPRICCRRHPDRHQYPTSKYLIHASLFVLSSWSPSLRSRRKPSIQPQAAPWNNCSPPSASPPLTRPMPSVSSSISALKSPS